MSFMPRFLPASLALAVLVFSLPAPSVSGQEPDKTPSVLRQDRISYALDRDVRLSMHDHAGAPLPFYSQRGYPVAFAQPGDPFSLHLENTLGERVKLVVSVDGINPRTGRKTYLGDKGYVLDPGQAVSIDQIVRSKKKEGPARALVFADTGAVRGTISIAVFRERMDYPFSMPWSYYQGKANAGTLLGTPQKPRWLPPSGARFRMLSPDPQERLYLEYAPLPDLLASEGR